MLTGLVLGEPERHREPTARRGMGEVWQSIAGPLVEFFRRRGAWLVLLFILLRKIGDTLANLTFRLLFDDMGYTNEDRKSVVSGKRVSVRVDLGGRRIIKTKK